MTDSFNEFVLVTIATNDYTPVTQILEFQPGETDKEVTITIVDDARIEEAENFELYLTGGAGVHLSPFSRAVVTIINDDGKLCTPDTISNKKWHMLLTAVEIP